MDNLNNDNDKNELYDIYVEPTDTEIIKLIRSYPQLLYNKYVQERIKNIDVDKNL